VGRRFEDLHVWKRAVTLSSEVYNNLRDLKNFGYRDQITRSCLSIPCNIAEGFERLSIKECIQLLSYAKGSCAEFRTQVYVGVEVSYIHHETGEKWLQESIELSSMISGLIKTKK